MRSDLPHASTSTSPSQEAMQLRFETTDAGTLRVWCRCDDRSLGPVTIDRARALDLVKQLRLRNSP